MSDNTLPIGIFDSGFGGLSVARAVRRLLPGEDIVYAADCDGAPWGERSDAYITKRLDMVVAFLTRQPVKALVVACNTATAVCVDHLRRELDIPVIGIEPAILPASRITQTGVIGVLATSKTVSSQKYAKLKERIAHVTVLDCACPGLMECVERGEFNHPDTDALIARFINPLIARGADALVLGCTHYPFLSEAIARVAGPGVKLIDPSPAVAKQLARRLNETGLLNTGAKKGRETFFVTGANAERQDVLHHLWSKEAKLEPLIIA